MKLFAVITKSLKEQVRSYWVLLLTLSMGPFFIFVYYLIVESSKPQYDILFVNNDNGLVVNNNRVNHGERLIYYFNTKLNDTSGIPFRVKEIGDRDLGVVTLKEKHADALLTIPETFSEDVLAKSINDSSNAEPVEFTGDLTNTSYLISAVWAGELLNNYMYQVTGKQKIVSIAEIPLGSSGNLDDFNLVVPGILVVSLIMLMFTASIAFVSEVENKTIMRLKLSRVTTLEFLGGIGIVQILVGVVSMVLTLLTAILLGFHYEGSLGDNVVGCCTYKHVDHRFQPDYCLCYPIGQRSVDCGQLSHVPVHVLYRCSFPTEKRSPVYPGRISCNRSGADDSCSCHLGFEQSTGDEYEPVQHSA